MGNSTRRRPPKPIRKPALQRVECLDQGKRRKQEHGGRQRCSAAKCSPAGRDDEQRSKCRRPDEKKRVIGDASPRSRSEIRRRMRPSATSHTASPMSVPRVDFPTTATTSGSADTSSALRRPKLPPTPIRAPTATAQPTAARGRRLWRPTGLVRPGRPTLCGESHRSIFALEILHRARNFRLANGTVSWWPSTGTGSAVTPNFFDSIGILWRRKILILLIVLVAVGATAGIDKSRTKEYQSTVTLYFLAQGVNTSSGASTALTAQQLATDVELVQSTPVQAAASKTLGGARAPSVSLPSWYDASSGSDRPVH